MVSSDLVFIDIAKQALDRSVGKSWRDLSDDDRELLERVKLLESKRTRLKKNVGPRYADCSFENYQATTAEQRAVVDRLRAYAAEIDSNVRASRKNVVLFGTKGTGKDHLLMATARETYRRGHVPHWVNGCDLHAELKRRDFAGHGGGDLFRSDEETASILWISDPLPPSGALTEYQECLLFRLIDKRYRACLPTWLTMNAIDGAEAEARMGAQTVDRLREGALVLQCYWASYRKLCE